MKLTGRVSLEELDTYSRYMGFDSWASYKLTLSDYEINLLIIVIYETRNLWNTEGRLMSISEPQTPLGVIILK